MSIAPNPVTAATQAKKAAATGQPRFKGKTGAKILHEMLVGPHQVEVMFGYPGGAILPVFDELYRTPAKFILNRHEQASGHCADGYARATGKPGVAIVTSGPAATNMITPARLKRAAESRNGGIVSIAKRIPRYVEPQIR